MSASVDACAGIEVRFPASPTVSSVATTDIAETSSGSTAPSRPPRAKKRMRAARIRPTYSLPVVPDPSITWANPPPGSTLSPASVAGPAAATTVRAMGLVSSARRTSMPTVNQPVRPSSDSEPSFAEGCFTVVTCSAFCREAAVALTHAVVEPSALRHHDHGPGGERGRPVTRSGHARPGSRCPAGSRRCPSACRSSARPSPARGPAAATRRSRRTGAARSPGSPPPRPARLVRRAHCSSENPPKPHRKGGRCEVIFRRCARTGAVHVVPAGEIGGHLTPSSGTRDKSGWHS